MRKKSKGMANGGMMRKVPKGMAAGGTKGEKLKMVTNDKGQEVPHFAADGQGKMAGGGKTRVANKMMPKGYFKGGKTMNEGGSTSIGGAVGKKGEEEKLRRMLEGRKKSSGIRGGPLKKEDIPTTKADPRLKKSDIPKRKKPLSKSAGGRAMKNKMNTKGGKMGGKS